MIPDDVMTQGYEGVAAHDSNLCLTQLSTNLITTLSTKVCPTRTHPFLPRTADPLRRPKGLETVLRFDTAKNLLRHAVPSKRLIEYNQTLK